MSRKIANFFAVFLVLVVAAIVMKTVRERPSANQNPLEKLSVDQIGQTDIAFPGFSVSLKKVNGTWQLVAPLADVADPRVMERLVASLRGMDMSVVISDKPEKQTEFGVDDKSATKVTLYADGAAKPVFDILIGAQGSSFGTVFVRYPGQNSVYLASGFAPSLLQASTDSYRLKQVVSMPPTVWESVSVQAGKVRFEASRSSATWTNLQTKSPIEDGWFSTLQQKISSLNASGFAQASSIKTFNPAKPFLTLDIAGSSQTLRVTVGDLLKDSKLPATLKDQYPVMVQGRADLLLVPSYSINDLADYLKLKAK